MKQELDNLNMPFMAKSTGPPWLPAPAVEAREISWWTQWILALLGLLLIIGGIFSLFTQNFFWAGYSLLSGVVYYFLIFMMKSTFFDVLDQGKFKEASDRLIIWAIVGLLFGLLPGLLLIFAYFRLKDVFQPNYQPYPTGTYQTGAPPSQQQYNAPPPQQAPPPQPPPQPAPPPQAPQEKPKHTDMVKCKKCGVQYPAFMRTCPNCNEPR